MKTIELDDDKIEFLFHNTNFGPTGENPLGRLGLMVECVLKQASGYQDGSTITSICMEAGLLNDRLEPTRQGMRWAFNQIYNIRGGGTTIVENLYE